jgi:hypothetical protein
MNPFFESVVVPKGKGRIGKTEGDGERAHIDGGDERSLPSRGSVLKSGVAEDVIQDGSSTTTGKEAKPETNCAEEPACQERHHGCSHPSGFPNFVSRGNGQKVWLHSRLNQSHAAKCYHFAVASAA